MLEFNVSFEENLNRRREKRSLETEREMKRTEIEKSNDFCKTFGYSEVYQKKLQNPMKEEQLH